VISSCLAAVCVEFESVCGSQESQCGTKSRFCLSKGSQSPASCLDALWRNVWWVATGGCAESAERDHFATLKVRLVPSSVLLIHLRSLVCYIAMRNSSKQKRATDRSNAFVTICIDIIMQE
jgi:hypothetical protein